jgi:hypothetical protein
VIGEIFPGCLLSFGQQGTDNRSYRVSFDKIKARLPGFQCAWDIRLGAQQLHDLFQQINLTPDIFNDRGFTRLRQLEYLIRTHQIDGNFFWTNGQSPAGVTSTTAK